MLMLHADVVPQGCLTEPEREAKKQPVRGGVQAVRATGAADSHPSATCANHRSAAGCAPFQFPMGLGKADNSALRDSSPGVSPSASNRARQTARPSPMAHHKNDIQLQRINYLRGPNVWTYRPVLEVWLDLGELEDFPSNLLPGFTDRLVATLPALVEHHCGVGERGGFIERLTEGTWAGHVLEHVVIELLNLAGMPTGFGQTRSTSQRGVYRMVFRARDEHVARKALAAGHALLMSVINDQPFDLPAAVAQIRVQVDDSYFGPSTAAIVAAATDRRIPHIRLNGGNLVQLGHGAAQRRIWTAETDQTSAIAENIASDKDLTKQLLKACGVPVPEGSEVDSAEAAWEAAQDIGLPVVVKPTDGNHGRGVTLNLETREDIVAAYDLAKHQGSGVLVERHVPGEEHRLLVVGGAVVAASRGESAWITGDGLASIEALIATQINSDPRRGEGEEFPLSVIKLDHPESAVRVNLRRQGLERGSVPAAGQRVLIVANGNLAIDCTDEVHPEVAHAATLAARVVGLDIAGIDLVTNDVSKPLQSQGGAIVEVNAGPGLLMHLKPAVGTPRPVGRAIVDQLFQPAETGRIPIVGVAGTQGTTTAARLLAWLLHLGGRHVGLACRDGVFLGPKRIDRADGTRFDPAHRLLMNRRVTTAVFEHNPESILRDGLVYDRCQVGVVTDLGGAEKLAHHDVHESDQLVKVLRTQVDVVLASGIAVLNASDERVSAMASLCDGDVILYAVDASLPAVVAHRAKGARGGRAVFERDGRIILATGSAESRLASLDRLTRRWGGPGKADTVALLPAIAAAWALDIPPDLIVAGIETFDTELPQAHLGGRA
jgi:cyanophycin synthetase